MERVNVTSSNVKSIGYDEKLSILEVEFNNGYIYQYSSVPVEIYKNFMSASSKGKFVNIFLKDKYPTIKVN